MEALVRDRDAALAKARQAEVECAKWKADAEASAELEFQVQGLTDTVRDLEAQLGDCRAFELQMARITSSLEQERDLLQTEVLKYAGLDVSRESVQKLTERVEQLEKEKQRQREDFKMTIRTYGKSCFFS